MTHNVEMTRMEILIVTSALKHWEEKANAHPDDKKICMKIRSRICDQVSQELSGRKK